MNELRAEMKIENKDKKSLIKYDIPGEKQETEGNSVLRYTRSLKNT